MLLFFLVLVFCIVMSICIDEFDKLYVIFKLKGVMMIVLFIKVVGVAFA